MKRLILLLTLFLTVGAGLRAESLPTDSVTYIEQPDSLPPLEGNWVQQLYKSGFHINDPRIDYPAFPRFCLKVYNWGDKAFNSYDPEYVQSTGKNWKLFVTSYNWNQTYRYVFSLFDKNNVSVRSFINTDLGISLNFMAVGLSYTRNMNNTVDGKKRHRDTFDFSFTCSRFSAEVSTQSTKGNAYIERFGNYNDGKSMSYPIEGLSQSNKSVTAYYFFNHRKYSQSAAYAYSKYQLKSAGSWIAGARWSHQRIVMDFSELPDEMKEANPNFPLINTFNFSEYSLLGGYAYNWVLGKHWLINGTALPCIGYRRSDLHSASRARRELVATTLVARTSVTYNQRMLFVSLVGKYTGGLLFNNAFSFYNATQSATVVLGVRF